MSLQKIIFGKFILIYLRLFLSYIKNGLNHIDANIGRSIIKANEFILNKISTVFSESLESFKEFNVGNNQERPNVEIFETQTNNAGALVSKFFPNNSFGNINILK